MKVIVGGALKFSVELCLEFIRRTIASNRGRSPELKSGALTFAVEAASGLTDYFTVFITEDDVVLKPGAAPLSWVGPLVTVFVREDLLSGIMHGGPLTGTDVMGDTQLLSLIALTFGHGIEPSPATTNR